MHAPWMLFATTGMRRGEVAGLRWSDVDLDGARLTVSQTVTVAGNVLVWADSAKTDAGARTMALDPATVAALRAHPGPPAPSAGDDGSRLSRRRAGPARVRVARRLCHPSRPVRAMGRWARATVRPAGDRRPRRPTLLRHGCPAGGGVARGAVQAAGARGRGDHAVYLAHVRPGDDEDAAVRAASAILGP